MHILPVSGIHTRTKPDMALAIIKNPKIGNMCRTHFRGWRRLWRERASRPDAKSLEVGISPSGNVASRVSIRVGAGQAPPEAHVYFRSMWW